MATSGNKHTAFQDELQRVLASEKLRTAESLRRLLTYLGDAYMNGTSRHMREYTIGREVMGKPEDYDPRVDASVRVQIGKLRQRLDRYYATEAQDARVQLSIPKGHFALVFQPPTAPPASLQGPPPSAPSTPSTTIWQRAAIALGAITFVLSVIIIVQWRNAHSEDSALTALPLEVEQFWRPIVSTPKPVVVVLGSPMFVRLNSHYFRNPWVNEWKDAETQIPLKELSKLVGSPTPPSPTYRWTPFGEAAAAFRLATVLGPLKDLVLKRSTVLAWEDVRSSNLIFLGPAKFNRQLPELPVEQDFIIDQGIVKNLRPRPGELDRYQKPSAPDVEDIPEDYAVITRVHGVTGWGEVLVLASTSTEGTWAAAEYLTTPNSLDEMMKRLRADTGKLPDNYQVLIRSRFKSQVPIHMELVTHHVVQPRYRK